jgi:hypothetical protein
MSRTLYVSVKAVCHICGATNRRGLTELLQRNNRCSGCTAPIARELWHFPDGVSLTDAQLTISCPSCHKDFPGPVWMTLCPDCYRELKQGTKS